MDMQLNVCLFKPLEQNVQPLLISTCLWLVLISRIYIVLWGTLGSSTLSTSVWYIVSICHPLLRINDKSNSNRGLFFFYEIEIIALI